MSWRLTNCSYSYRLWTKNINSITLNSCHPKRRNRERERTMMMLHRMQHYPELGTNRRTSAIGTNGRTSATSLFLTLYVRVFPLSTQLLCNLCCLIEWPSQSVSLPDQFKCMTEHPQYIFQDWHIKGACFPEHPYIHRLHMWFNVTEAVLPDEGLNLHQWQPADQWQLADQWHTRLVINAITRNFILKCLYRVFL